MIKECVNVIEGCQRISGGLSRKLLTNIRSHTIGFLYYLMAVLVAISIPIFTTQLEKSREATDMANIRSAYGQIVADYLTAGSSNFSSTISVAAKQTQANWQTDNNSASTNIGTSIGNGGTVTVPAKLAGNSYVVSIDTAGSVTVS